VNPNWRDHAACLGVGGDLFFPEPKDTGREAKAICRRCPVIADCLEDALSLGYASDLFGIRGGLGVKQRKRLRRESA
jgi:WhiB family redox-sensing transcriptional regulator